MGIMALGFGFGGVLGVAGALYHMLNHTLNKSLMFFGAGSMMRSYETKDIGAIRDVGRRFPVVGALWLAGAVAITGAPPFGLFASEFTILRAGLRGPQVWAAIVMALLLIVIFIAFLNHFRMMYFTPTEESPPPAHPVSAWCAVPMWLAFVPLLVLGLWWPDAIWRYFGVIAHGLTAGTMGASP
jgi:hydrogenase-4 component F